MWNKPSTEINNALSLATSRIPRNIGKFNFKKVYGCKMTENGLNIDQIIKDSWHGAMKEMQLLMVESYLRYIYCLEIENP